MGLKNKLQQIREACIKANMEGFGMVGKVEISPYMRPVRLADVLLAMSQTGTVTKGANFLVNVVEIGHGVGGSGLFQDVRWNLKDDNLDNQSSETIDFIHSLLT